ncbi:MAG: hypothetical protein J1F12_06115 [Muribaculaceae bacterium]|nr:hypothetical protein [Muribaculaceae bacterium]
MAETIPIRAYDIDMAKEICSELPLESIEGIWLYPEDKVTVLILQNPGSDVNGSPYYDISVVSTSDANLNPGDLIGNLQATADMNVYRFELFTEKKNDYLLKPKSCLATLSKDGETFLIKKQKSPFKGRLNLNFNRLLPGFWKIISTGLSTSGNNMAIEPPVGMIKVFPSYDGNGSSRRKIRYL